jgi:hypothetical protein
MPTNSPKLGSFIFRCYLSKAAQLIVLTLLGFTLLLSYVISHMALWDSYWSEVETGATSALHVVRIDLDKEQARFVLSVGGKALEAEGTLPPLPFGLEKVGSVKGTLAHYSALVEQANASLNVEQERLLRGFRASGGYYALDGTRLALPSRVEIRMGPVEFAELRRLKGYAFQQAFQDLLYRQSIYRDYATGGEKSEGATASKPPALAQSDGANTSATVLRPTMAIAAAATNGNRRSVAEKLIDLAMPTVKAKGLTVAGDTTVGDPATNQSVTSLTVTNAAASSAAHLTNQIVAAVAVVNSAVTNQMTSSQTVTNKRAAKQTRAHKRSTDEITARRSTIVVTNEIQYVRKEFKAFVDDKTTDAIEKVRAAGSQWSSTNVMGSLEFATLAERDQLGAYFQRWNENALRVLGVALITGTNGPTATDMNQKLGLINQSIGHELLSNLRQETRPMWLFGRYRWLEILFWVWFGVLTHSIITVGLYVVGAKEEMWQPSELLRIFSRFVYAPILVAALFFLGDMLGANAAVLDLGRNTWATLGIAFTLGMFPTTIYRLLHQFLTTVFRTELTTTSAPAPTPSVVKAIVKRPDPATKTPYTVSDLKKNLTEIVVAPLKTS